jgi:flavodoxin I
VLDSARIRKNRASKLFILYLNPFVNSDSLSKKALIVYWSSRGNTEKVAFALRDGLQETDFNVTVLKIKARESVDYFDYDLICVGFPVYHFHPPEIMDKFLKNTFHEDQKKQRILPGSPVIEGKAALIFCTYSGPHSGIAEALPAVKYAGQFFVHVGIPVIDEWYIVSEFHGREDLSTRGKLGDIRGKPSKEDLNKVRKDAQQLAKKLETGSS